MVEEEEAEEEAVPSRVVIEVEDVEEVEEAEGERPWPGGGRWGERMAGRRLGCIPGG